MRRIIASTIYSCGATFARCGYPDACCCIVIVEEDDGEECAYIGASVAKTEEETIQEVADWGNRIDINKAKILIGWQ